MNDIVTASLSKEERQVFDDIDSVVSRAVTIGDPLIALEYGSRLKRIQTVQGLALAKLLYKLQQSWELFKAAGTEDDLLTMVDVHMDVRPATTKKYLAMWEKIFENPTVPDDIKHILSGKPVGELLLLTAAVGEGSLSGANLRHAALAPDKATLREHIRKARGQQTSSKSAIIICLNMVDKSYMTAGTLYAKRGSEQVILGHLDDPSTELAEKAMERLKNAAGIQEVYR